MFDDWKDCMLYQIDVIRGDSYTKMLDQMHELTFDATPFFFLFPFIHFLLLIFSSKFSSEFVELNKFLQKVSFFFFSFFLTIYFYMSIYCCNTGDSDCLVSLQCTSTPLGCGLIIKYHFNRFIVSVC